MDVKKQYELWTTDPYFDEETKKELLALAGNDKEIEDRFYRDLEFGTAGLRGVLAAGSNRMNIYTVRRATQGLAEYILSRGKASRGVAIAYDSRLMSPEFADESALCLAANGIKAYIFPSLRPTPVLSFAVRELNCIAGINITASHNPSNYNGYKVYWEDGAQITPPHDKGIMGLVNSITDYSKCKTMAKDEAMSKGLYEVIPASLDEKYEDTIFALIHDRDSINKMAESISVVYTPLNGTGNIPVRRVLEKLGFKKVFVVPEQEAPDGHFPTVPYPNPESKDAFKLALALAEKEQADLVLATDPDADRLGVYVRDKAGEYHALNGNMSGCLIGDYLIGQVKKAKGLPADGAFIKSIVSTRLCDAIAGYYGIELVEVLTGFKFIGGKMLEFEKTGKGTYLFGMEESYGCLPGTYARDKDAVAACVILCEAASHFKARGKTLWDAMVELYDRVGYYTEDTISVEFAGQEGAATMEKIMSTLREDPPKKMGEYDVLAVRDYKQDIRKDLATGNTVPLGFPSSNVLYYELTDDSWFCVRPSGTEPKIKFYLGVRGTGFEDCGAKALKLKGKLQEILDNFK